LNADTSFPQFTKQTSDGEKIEQITSYLFMLLEQLRYCLGNLDKDNFNDAGLNEIGEIITAPVYVRLEGAEGSIHELNVTADSLSSSIADMEGNVSTLQQTADSLSTSVSDVEGNVSTLQQTVDSFSLSVTNGKESSTITLTANGVGISSQDISFSGMVTYEGLSGGTTTINGACIQTGAIKAIDIEGCSIEGCTFRSVMQGYGSYGGEIQFCYLYDWMVAGGIRLDDQGAGTADEARYRMYLYTQNVMGVSFAMKLESAGGVSITSPRNVYIYGGSEVQIDAAVIKLNGSVYINDVLYTPQSSG